MIQITEVKDGHRWNEALASLPYNHILQSYEWGHFKSRHSWTPIRLLFEQQGTVAAAASVLRREMSGLPLSVLYVPKGPALPYENSELLGRVLAALEETARIQRSVFVKIDPDVPLGWAREDLATAQEVKKTLRGRGWIPSREQIQFKSTLLIDLRDSEEELLGKMKPKTRYNVRLAGRRGVQVIRGTVKDLPSFYDLYSETSVRDGFIIRPFDYYRDVWQTFLEGELAQLFLAVYKEEILAGLIIFRFGEKVWYMYGASTARHRNLMPNHLLQWEAMRWARAQGCTVYDMWGGPDVMDQSDPLWGVYRFKSGFGGQLVHHIGAYDYAPWPPLYWLYHRIMPLYLELLRKRYRRQGLFEP
ncbi:MAG: lipid II:glycine glycyltransferase FemX [Anaerolineae bacterium]